MILFSGRKLITGVHFLAKSLLIVAAGYSCLTSGKQLEAAGQTPKAQTCMACQADDYNGPACEQQIATLRASTSRGPRNADLLRNLAGCIWTRTFLTGENN